MLILIAQKKRLGAMNATQKNHRSLSNTVTEIIKKNLKKFKFSLKMPVFFGDILVFFSVKVLGKDL